MIFLQYLIVTFVLVNPYTKSNYGREAGLVVVPSLLRISLFAVNNNLKSNVGMYNEDEQRIIEGIKAYHPSR